MNTSTADTDHWIGRVCFQIAEGVDSALLGRIDAAPTFFAGAAELALPDSGPGCTLRLVGAAESQALNFRHRQRDSATNVLSFPQSVPAELAALLPEDLQSQSLGDVVLCLKVAAREAEEQGKVLEHHLIHLVVHGVLHLRGFDHITDSEATVMERAEINLLAQRNITNPYEDTRGQTPDSHG